MKGRTLGSLGIVMAACLPVAAQAQQMTAASQQASSAQQQSGQTAQTSAATTGGSGGSGGSAPAGDGKATSGTGSTGSTTTQTVSGDQQEQSEEEERGTSGDTNWKPNFLRVMTHATAKKVPDNEMRIPPESYTRLIIEDKLAAESERELTEWNEKPENRGRKKLTLRDATARNAKRNRFHRFLSSKEITFEATLTTQAGRFKEVTPLLFRQYESSRKKGENFTRDLMIDDHLFPMFLVTGDPSQQIARFTLETRFDYKPSTDAAGLAQTFLSTALKAVSPSSAVVTSLTSDAAEKVASKLDESYGKFFAESVKEKMRFDLDLYQNQAVELSLYGGRTEEQTLNPENVIGKWKISFAKARPSIFSSIDCTIDAVSGACSEDTKKKAFNDAKTRPNAVLSFALIDKIGNSGTVLSYLKQQDWWSDMASLAKPEDYGTFCRRIRGAMGEIGLSDTDGKIIAYAVSQSGSVSDTVKAGMEKADDCLFEPKPAPGPKPPVAKPR